MTTLLLTDADRYFAGVREALSDLAAGNREDLLEDVQAQLDELLAEEPNVDLVSRLGAPSAYASELRQAAGLPAQRAGFGVRLERWRGRAFGRLRSWPAVPAVLTFLPQLRPAWWVLRAWGVVAIADRLLHDGQSYIWGIALVPEPHGSPLFGVLLLAGLVVLSVRLGQRTWPPGFWRGAVVTANVALAFATPAYFVVMAQDRSFWQATNPCCGYLYRDGGSPILNLYAYDEQGRPIPRVQLFDQDGTPVDITANVPALTNVFPQPINDGTLFAPDGTPLSRVQPPPIASAPVLPPAASPSP